MQAAVPNGGPQGDRQPSLGSTASISLGSSRAGSQQSKSSSLGSMNGDRFVLKPNRPAQICSVTEDVGRLAIKPQNPMHALPVACMVPVMCLKPQ